MPVGVYRKRTKNGRWMYFRDGKLISKKSYDASTSRRNGNPRKATNKKKNNSKRSYMRKSLPHPSVTGMASGLAIAAYLNAGKTTRSGQNGFPVVTTVEGVIKDITDGQLGTAFSTLSGNAINLIASDAGRKTLVTAGLVAALGAVARRQFPRLKLGGKSLYFTL